VSVAVAVVSRGVSSGSLLPSRWCFGGGVRRRVVGVAVKATRPQSTLRSGVFWVKSRQSLMLLMQCCLCRIIALEGERVGELEQRSAIWKLLESSSKSRAVEQATVAEKE